MLELYIWMPVRVNIFSKKLNNIHVEDALSEKTARAQNCRCKKIYLRTTYCTWSVCTYIHERARAHALLSLTSHIDLKTIMNQLSVAPPSFRVGGRRIIIGDIRRSTADRVSINLSWKNIFAIVSNVPRMLYLDLARSRRPSHARWMTKVSVLLSIFVRFLCRLFRIDAY